MGINFENFVHTQPNTYNLFKILYLTSGNEEEVENDEGFKKTINIVKDRQDETIRQLYAQQELNFANEGPSHIDDGN